MMISVIVPVFNASNYLSRCIESILSQTYEDIEIILIDDGSTDNSLSICNTYKEIDKRVQVMAKTNGGVSSARNVGLDCMNGDFVVFIDSDDYIENNMIETMLNDCLNNDVDISMCGVIKEFSNGSRINKKLECNSKIYLREEAISNILDHGKYHGYIGNKMFSNKIINAEESLRFDETIHVCEDLLFCIKAFFKSNKSLYNPKQLYHYVFHDSNSSQKYSERKLTAICAYQGVFNLMEIEGFSIPPTFKCAYNKLIISLMIMNQKSSNLDKKRTHDLLKAELYRFSLMELLNMKVFITTLIARITPRILVFLKK